MEVADFLIAIQETHKLAQREHVELKIFAQSVQLFVRVEFGRHQANKIFPYHELCASRTDIFNPAVHKMIRAIKWENAI